MTIDGVNVPSPESGVRQIKLDTLASDLVESVEINKTLQANMDGDGIGDRDTKWSEAVRARLQDAGLRVIQDAVSGAECQCLGRTVRAA